MTDLEVISKGGLSLWDAELDRKLLKNNRVLTKWVGVVRTWNHEPAWHLGGGASSWRSRHTGVRLTEAVFVISHEMIAAD